MGFHGVRLIRTVMLSMVPRLKGIRYRVLLKYTCSSLDFLLNLSVNLPLICIYIFCVVTFASGVACSIFLISNKSQFKTPASCLIRFAGLQEMAKHFSVID